MWYPLANIDGILIEGHLQHHHLYQITQETDDQIAYRGAQRQITVTGDNTYTVNVGEHGVLIWAESGHHKILLQLNKVTINRV